MLINLPATKNSWIEANRLTLVFAALKLILYILLLAYTLSKNILLTEDITIYSGKNQIVACYWCLSALSLGMIFDASFVLGRNKQSESAGKRRGIIGVLLQVLMLPLSPTRIPRWIIIAATLGIVVSSMFFLAEIFSGSNRFGGYSIISFAK
jgi:hypothetical protein